MPVAHLPVPAACPSSRDNGGMPYRRRPSSTPTSRVSVHIIDVDGIEVRVTRKRIKNMYLRIKPPTGTVEVSAPMRMAERRIVDFVRERRGWILGQRERIAQARRLAAAEMAAREASMPRGEDSTDRATAASVADSADGAGAVGCTGSVNSAGSAVFVSVANPLADPVADSVDFAGSVRPVGFANAVEVPLEGLDDYAGETRLASGETRMTPNGPNMAPNGPSASPGEPSASPGEAHASPGGPSASPGINPPSTSPVVPDRAIIWTDERRRHAAAAIEAALPALLDKWTPVVGKAPTHVTLRLMTSRWGSCTPKTGRIRLNLQLGLMEPKFLEYVLVHELTHLWEHGHGPRFRARMDAYLPGWRELRRELNRRAVL